MKKQKLYRIWYKYLYSALRRFKETEDHVLRMCCLEKAILVSISFRHPWKIENQSVTNSLKLQIRTKYIKKHVVASSEHKYIISWDFVDFTLANVTYTQNVEAGDRWRSLVSDKKYLSIRSWSFGEILFKRFYATSLCRQAKVINCKTFKMLSLLCIHTFEKGLSNEYWEA